MRNIKLQRLQRVSTFRRLALAAWGAPRDPTVYGSVEVDATAALAYLEEASRRSGEKVTMTHLVGRALAQLLAEHPNLNVVVRWGRFYRREDVDIFFQVAMPGDGSGADADLSGAVVRRADTKRPTAIAAELRDKASRVRKDTDAELARTRRSLQGIPGLLLRPLVRLLDFLQYGLNLALPGLPRDAFGSAMITSVGMFGITQAYAPLFPPSHCPIVTLVAAITRRPWVVVDADGSERIDIRPILPLYMSFDHRVMDGFQAGRLSRRMRELIADPRQLDADTDA